MTGRIDIVIPTYNGAGFLRRCLEALQLQTRTGFRTIVVDDCSTDDTASMLRSRFPDAIRVQMRRNSGFAAAANAGIDAGASELVVLLNNDTEPRPDWLAELEVAIDRHPDAASVTSKIMLASRPGRLHSAGDTYSRRGVAGNRGVWERDAGQYDVEEEVFGACAAAAMYRRSALIEARNIDGAVFDPDFVMYCEDVDLNWRLRLLGHSIVYAPTAVVSHHLSATGGGSLASYYVARNNFGVIAKNLPGRLIRRNAPSMVFQQARSFTAALLRVREPAARARMRGVLAGPWFAMRMRHKRRRIQAARIMADVALEQWLEP